MEYLSKHQLSLLLKCKSDLDCSNISAEDLSVYRYLAKLGYVRIKSSSYGEASYGGYSFRSKAETVHITEAGNTYLETFNTDNKRYKHKLRIDLAALIISLAAFVISILAFIFK